METQLRQPLDVPGFVFRTVSAAGVSAEDRALMHELFDACYREANHEHLDTSLTRLRYATFAHQDGRPAAFGLADSRVAELPRLPRTTVLLGGLCCVLPEFRRHGLFGALMARSMVAGDRVDGPRSLSCGRTAHPGAFRFMSRNPTSVPKPGVAPTSWQREVGQAVADIYRVERFDPETFVCRGSGRPIGYPVMELEVDGAEWEVFRPVDRDRGDVLLGLAWNPDAPEGW